MELVVNFRCFVEELAQSEHRLELLRRLQYSLAVKEPVALPNFPYK